MKYLLMALGFCWLSLTSPAHATPVTLTKMEKEITVRIALNEEQLNRNFQNKEKELRKKILSNTELLRSFQQVRGSHDNRCDDRDDDHNNIGEERCWDACTNEGYGSSTCAERCGRKSANGAKKCWDKCSNEGYSSNTCAERCGTDTSTGGEMCWDKCSNEGYGSSTCSTRCGIDSPKGTEKCWDKCTSEGYGSSTCTDRCNSK